MARILGSLIGELRGKVGGAVYSRNRAGAYMRAYAKPVDPRSTAQLGARNAFGASSSAYHSMSDTQKSAWSAFANQFFNPLSGTNTGQFSGQNAFNSLINVQRQGLLNAGIAQMETNVPAINVEELSYAIQFDPPNQGISSILNAGGTAYYNLNIVGASLTQAGLLDISFSSGGSSTPGPFDKEFGSALTSSTGQTVGISVYMSSITKQFHDYKTTDTLVKLIQTGPISFSGGTSAQVLNIGAQRVTLFNTLKNTPKTGDAVRLSAYFVDLFGQQIKFDEKDILIY